MEKLHENPFIVNELKHILKVDYTISNILCLISCGDPVGATSRSRPGGRSYRREDLQSTITVEFLNETIFIRIGIIHSWNIVDQMSKKLSEDFLERKTQ